MKKFALLVGNGFTLDLVSPLGLHSSYPLQNFNSRDISYNDFLHKLPAINSELFGQSCDDFTAIINYIKNNMDDDVKDCQLRRFLALAYSKFQLIVDSYQSHLLNWKWLKWIQENQHKLTCAISLNYDRNLENVLDLAKIPYHRVGTNEILGRVPVMKPHGSIDFDIPKRAISCDIESRWTLTTKLNDGEYMEVVPKSEWLIPRIEPDIVPPSVLNIQLHLKWVKEISRIYQAQASELDAFVIIGNSYWDVDRPEIDSFLSQLRPRTKVYVIDPNPNKELIKKIQSLGLSYKKPKSSGFPW